jgi:hypothetical protein
MSQAYYGTPYYQNGPSLHSSYSGQNAPYVYGGTPPGNSIPISSQDDWVRVLDF